jgi:hypothetical protein
MIKYKAFVSMPFGKSPSDKRNPWRRIYEYGIKPCETLFNQSEKFHNVKNIQLKITRADYEIKRLGLKNNVMELIDECDFVICLLSKYSSSERASAAFNPNLFWEIGYSEAKGKPIVFLGDEPDFYNVPVMVGRETLFCTINPEEFEGECSDQELKELGLTISKKIIPFLISAIQSLESWRPGRKKRYEVTAYTDLDTVNILNFINSSRSNIDILTTNLNYFVDFEKKDKSSGLHQAIENALLRGVKIRALVLDPESVISDYRAKQLGTSLDVPTYREDIRQSAKRFYEKYKKYYGKLLSIRLYNDLPLQPTIRIDNKVIAAVSGKRYWGPIHILFRLEDEGVSDSFTSHFSSFYETARDIREVSWLK